MYTQVRSVSSNAAHEGHLQRKPEIRMSVPYWRSRFARVPELPVFLQIALPSALTTSLVLP